MLMLTRRIGEALIIGEGADRITVTAVSYTHLRAHET